MNKQLLAAVEYCRSTGIQRAVFVVPFEVEPAEVDWLRAQRCCGGMVLRNPAPEITATSSGDWLGRYTDDGLDWIMPGARGRVVFVGPQLMVTWRMVQRTARARGHLIVCRTEGGFVRLGLHRFVLWRIGDATIRWLGTFSADHAVVRLVNATKRVTPLRRLWHALLRRKIAVPGPVGPLVTDVETQATSHLGGVALYRQLLARARESARTANPCIPGTVVLVNAGLAAGGAERQIVNTLLGLKDRGLENVSMIGEYLLTAPELDFYLPSLQAAGIRATQVQRRVNLFDHGLSSLTPALAELLTCVPTDLVEEILNLTEEFRARRPEVVHAWQDSTSIKAGIAAVIAGVPRLVLSSRNVNPTNFLYARDYMKPAYLALSELENIVFVNNSEAGAQDYCNWLGLPRQRFRVVRNGIDFSRLKRPEASAISNFRAGFGIPPSAPVIGSVFRFWEEKRPMLWLEVAARVAHAVPAAHFLIVGDGPMRHDMEQFIRANGLAGRAHLPGTRPDVATPLSAMNLFLLTSAFEGTPNVVLEAQWLGVPVVATNAGGTRETVDQGVTGWTCGLATADAVADRVTATLFDVAWCEKARRRAPSFVEERFGLGHMLDETVALYGLDDSRSRKPVTGDSRASPGMLGRGETSQATGAAS
jgi:glycosyltransferase involved in cell wall biosynthesis